MPKRRLPLTDEEGEVRELTRADFKGMRPVREAMPELIEAMAEFRRTVGRPKGAAPKVHVSFRLSRPTSSLPSRRAAPATTPGSKRPCARRGSATRRAPLRKSDLRRGARRRWPALWTT